MDPFIGQFVYFNKRPWYGARLVIQSLAPFVIPVNSKRVTSARGHKGLFLSFLSARAYPEIFKVLERAKIPLWAKDRNSNIPLVVAGGGACFNPELIW